ncbi:hypothetical protein PInf_005290 [Phytophthora infestans]|nr:hypothetical protein PInf_005290 [Phytophthora infestans]
MFDPAQTMTNYKEISKILDKIAKHSGSPKERAALLVYYADSRTRSSELLVSSGPLKKKTRCHELALGCTTNLKYVEAIASSVQTRKTATFAASKAKTKSAKAASTLTTKLQTKKRQKVQRATTRTVLEPGEAKSMRWTITLTSSALETRFKNPIVLKKFTKKTVDTKKMRAIWEDTVNIFLQRALIEQAWGKDPARTVTVNQFKSKLNAIRKAYKAKRTRMLGTGNETEAAATSDDESGQRHYPELPTDFLADATELSPDDGDDGAPSYKKLVCDPMNVNGKYRRELGNELCTLWPLFPGLTGEAITESGKNTSRASSGEEDGDARSNHDNQSDEECSDSSCEVRAKAKTTAKAKQRQKQQKHRGKQEQKRPVDVLNETLRDGFGAVERIFTARQTGRAKDGVTALVDKLVASVESSNVQQQATTEAIRQSIDELSKTTADLLKELMKQIKKNAQD